MYSEPIDKNDYEKIHENLIDNINHFKNYTDSKNVKLYIIIEPARDIIYSEKLLPYVNITYKNSLELVDKIKNNTDVKIIYPYEDLMKMKDSEYVYFKTDHHWSDIGAFIAYNELVKEIKQDFPNYKTQSLNNFDISYNNLVRAEVGRNFNYGSHYYSMNVKNKKILDTKYKYLDHKDYKNIDIVYDKAYSNRYYNYKNAKNNLTLFLFGNSMTENFAPLIVYDFKKTAKIRSNHQYLSNDDKNEYSYKRIVNEIEKLEYKPSIVLIVISENRIKKDFLNYGDD